MIARGRAHRTAYVWVILAAAAGGTTVLACGDDSDPVAKTADAGREATVRETGVLRDCTPQPVPAFTFTPPPPFQQVCPDEDIQNILANCVFDDGTEATCDAAIAAAPENCLSCIAGAFDSVPSRPLVRYSNEAPLYANSGTCMATFANDTNPKGCAVAFGQIETCSYASCVDSCAGADDDALVACIANSIGTICTEGAETFRSDACAAAYGGKTYGFCVSGDKPGADAGTKLDNLEYYALVTKLACGFPPSAFDAGAPDAEAGTPDADAPDADAGDADVGP